MPMNTHTQIRREEWALTEASRLFKVLDSCQLELVGTCFYVNANKAFIGNLCRPCLGGLRLCVPEREWVSGEPSQQLAHNMEWLGVAGWCQLVVINLWSSWPVYTVVLFWSHASQMMSPEATLSGFRTTNSAASADTNRKSVGLWPLQLAPLSAIDLHSW